MKKFLLVVLAVCGLVAMMGGVAFAQGWAGNGVTSYLTPSVSPHGGWSTTSKNCGVCHSVHHAQAGGEALMRGPIANSCAYCHITTNTGFITIYDAAGAGGTADNYINASDYAHDTSGTLGVPGSDGVTCVQCHQVHAASTLTIQPATNAWLAAKILRTGPFQAGVAIASGDASGVAVSKWCTKCHEYYNERFDGASHVMTAPAGNYSNHRTADGKTAASVTTTVAWATSRECHSCHDRGLTGRTEAVGVGVIENVVYSFPHYSDGKRWLSRDTTALAGMGSVAVTGTTDTNMDIVCIRCHRDGSGNGIGATF